MRRVRRHDCTEVLGLGLGDSRLVGSGLVGDRQAPRWSILLDLRPDRLGRVRADREFDPLIVELIDERAVRKPRNLADLPRVSAGRTRKSKWEGPATGLIVVDLALAVAGVQYVRCPRSRPRSGDSRDSQSTRSCHRYCPRFRASRLRSGRRSNGSPCRARTPTGNAARCLHRARSQSVCRKLSEWPAVN